jgi:hypothetical protein
MSLDGGYCLHTYDVGVVCCISIYSCISWNSFIKLLVCSST